MRAIAITEQGADPTLTEVPTPQPGPGEVLVRVEASSVNGFDISVAAGHVTGMMEHRYPVVLGKDFAGTVAAIGDSVTGYAAGDRVFGVVTKPFVGDGCFGEYVTVSDQIGIAALPESIDFATAGALGLAGTAALDLLAAVGLKPGDSVLISGATGGVGAIAVQYAAAAGVRVIATARPGTQTDFVRGLGATDVVDYAGDLPGQVRALSPDGVGAVLHLAGDGAALASLLSEKGILASLLGFGADQHPAATFVLAQPTPETLGRLAADVAAGRISVPVAHTYALTEVPTAFDHFTSGTVGKIAITVA